MRSSWLLYFQLSFLNELSFKSCPSLASKSQSSLGSLSSFRFSLSISLENLSFSLSSLLHSSAGTLAPSLSWVIPPCRPCPHSPRGERRAHSCPRHSHCLAGSGHFLRSQQIYPPLTPTPKSCKYLPLCLLFLTSCFSPFIPA